MGENLTLKGLDIDLDLDGILDVDSDGTLIQTILPVKGFGSMMVTIRDSKTVTLKGQGRLFWDGKRESNLNFNGQMIDMLDSAESGSSGWFWSNVGNGYQQHKTAFRFMSHKEWFTEKIREDVTRAIFEALKKFERERPEIFLLADRRNLLGEMRRADHEEKELLKEIEVAKKGINDLLKQKEDLREKRTKLDWEIEVKARHLQGCTDGLGRTFF